MVKLRVNGKDVDVDGSTPLLWVLREQLGLTGAKYSCGIGLCGACAVHVDGKAVRSCTVPMSSFDGTGGIVTIEGLSADDSPPCSRRRAHHRRGRPGGAERHLRRHRQARPSLLPGGRRPPPRLDGELIS